MYRSATYVLPQTSAAGGMFEGMPFFFILPPSAVRTEAVGRGIGEAVKGPPNSVQPKWRGEGKVVAVEGAAQVRTARREARRNR